MMFARKPPIADPWNFLRTFTPVMWLWILISFLAVACGFVIANHFTEPRYKICKHKFSESATKLSLDMFGMFLQQGKLHPLYVNE